MKKLLLFVIAFVIGFSVSAQKAGTLTPKDARAKALREINRIEPSHTDNPAAQPEYIPRTFKGSNAAVKKVIMGTSINAYTLLVNEQTCMYYNKELDAIMGTFRGNQNAVGTLPILGSGNTVNNYFSTDGGTTFTGKIGFSEAGILPRYPSGVLFNTTGNTTLNLAYTAIAGPEATGPWALTYLGSMQINQDKKDVQTVATSSYSELVRQGMNACTDGTVHIGGMKYTPTTYLEAIGIVKNGVFNSTTSKFEWTQVDVPLPFLHKASDGSVSASLGGANMAWNKSGSVGYIMFTGVDTTGTGKRGYYPIVFKSVNKGVTWTKMPYFDFSKFPLVQDKLMYSAGPKDTDPAVPWFWESDIVVDNSDNLHIMALLKSHASTHPDSLNWYSANEAGPIMEFSFERNQWLCNYITTPKTHEVVAAESPYVSSPNNVDWDMRLQASRTDDGKKVFAVWTDTDWTNWSLADSLNLYPDVLIWGRDVVTNKSTKVKNITDLQEGWGECHFMFVSPIAADKSGVYTVPVSISDINTSNLLADSPLAHYYLQGVTLSDADFTIVGTKPTSKVEAMEVTSYPNPPVNGKTNIVVKLERSAPVSVIITSVTGQQVSRVSYGTMNAGSQTLPVDASNLKSGVYFYTVIIGNQRATNKMVIK